MTIDAVKTCHHCNTAYFLFFLKHHIIMKDEAGDDDEFRNSKHVVDCDNNTIAKRQAKKDGGVSFDFGLPD